MKKITAIIVEDEAVGALTLINLLNEYCDDVEVIGIATSVNEAKVLIDKRIPDVVFLDVEMPPETGFMLLEYYDDIPFEIIFTTAHGEHAVMAFRVAAVDFILKPIGIEDLKGAVERLRKKLDVQQSRQNYKVLQNNLNSNLKKITLPTAEGFSFIDVDDVIYCKAVNNYTSIHLVDKRKILVSKTLGDYEDMLSFPMNFYRINRSYLVNLAYVKEYIKAKQPTIVMQDGTHLELSTRRRKGFLDRLNQL